MEYTKTNLTKKQARFVKYLVAKTRRGLLDANNINKALFRPTEQYERELFAVETYLPFVKIEEASTRTNTDGQKATYTKTWRVTSSRTIYDNQAHPFIEATFTPFVKVLANGVSEMDAVGEEIELPIVTGDEVTIGIADAYIKKHQQIEDFRGKRYVEIQAHTELAQEIQKELEQMSQSPETLSQQTYNAKVQELQEHLAQATVFTECLETGNWNESTLQSDLTHFKNADLLFEYELEESDLYHEMLNIVVKKVDGKSPLNGGLVMECRNVVEFIDFGERLVRNPQPISEFYICDVSDEELEEFKETASVLEGKQEKVKASLEDLRKKYARLLEASQLEISKMAEIFTDTNFIGKYFTLKKDAKKIGKRKQIVEKHSKDFLKEYDNLHEQLKAINKDLSLAKTRLHSAQFSLYKIQAHPERITFKHFTEAKKLLEKVYSSQAKKQEADKEADSLQLAATIAALMIQQGLDKDMAVDKAVSLSGMLFSEVKGFNALAWLVAMTVRKQETFIKTESFDVGKVQKMAKMLEERMPLDTAYGIFSFFLRLKQPTFNQKATS